MTFDVAAGTTTGSWAAGPPLAGPFADYARVRPGQRVWTSGADRAASQQSSVARLGADHVRSGRSIRPFVEAARLRHRASTSTLRAAERSPTPTPRSTRRSPTRRPLHGGSGGRPSGDGRVTRPQGIVAACQCRDHGNVSRVAEHVLARRATDRVTADDESQLAGARRTTWASCSGPPGWATSRRRADGRAGVRRLRRLVGAVHAGRQARASGYVAGLDENGRTRLRRQLAGDVAGRAVCAHGGRVDRPGRERRSTILDTRVTACASRLVACPSDPSTTAGPSTTVV